MERTAEAVERLRRLQLNSRQRREERDRALRSSGACVHRRPRMPASRPPASVGRLVPFRAQCSWARRTVSPANSDPECDDEAGVPGAEPAALGRGALGVVSKPHFDDFKGCRLSRLRKQSK